MNAALNGPFGRTTLGPTPLTIGRTPDNQLVLNNPKTSSHHAEIRPDGQGYSIIDLGSTNGTFINEQPLERNVPRMLNPGDTIRIGDLTFTYEASGTPGIGPTVYANPSQGNAPGYLPTVAAPPPTAYGNVNAQQSYQQPPAYSSYPDAAQSPFAPPPPQQPYSVPPQQPYGTPGYPPPPVPSYAAPGTTQQKSRRGLWITLGIIGGVLLLFCIACTVFTLVVGSSTPTKTLQTYCDSLKKGDDQTAYNQYSSSFKSQLSESQFASSLNGVNISDCLISNVNDNGTTGTGTITYTGNGGRSVTIDYTLIDENGTWKISNEHARQ